VWKGDHGQSKAQQSQLSKLQQERLAILPVRYAVVPNTINATLPESMGNKVRNVKLAHHKYALRTLRQGYVYLFYEKHARGRHIKWETYSVSAAGLLFKQISIYAMQPISLDSACSITGHNIPTSVITIDTPEKCGRVWMAFSEHRWSEETFKAFEADAALRDRRMQTFQPARWVAARGYPHGMDATEANIGQVLEYKDWDVWHAMSSTPAVQSISKADGSFSSGLLARETTRYRIHGRHQQMSALISAMQEMGTAAKGNANAPAVIALWDAVGITHELAGFNHDVLGWVHKYTSEREFEVHAMTNLEGLKKAVADGAVASQTRYQGSTFEHSEVGERNAARRLAARRMAEPRQSQQFEVCDIVDDWAQKGVNYNLYEPALHSAASLSEPERSVEIKRIRVMAEKHLVQVRSQSWEKYEDKLDKNAFSHFQRQVQALQAAADKILNQRMGDLVAWLGSTSLIDALTEYHGEDLDDGVAFESLVGEAIHGMNGSAEGARKLEAWAQDTEFGEVNLLWRSLALNQKELAAELRSILAEAKQHQRARTLASAVEWTGYSAKSCKAFVETYKKFSAVQTANLAASSAGGSRAFGVKINPVNMHGVDKIVVTAGDRIFKTFSVPGLTDYASEKMIQHFFSLRAAVSAEDSIDLIKTQAINEGVARSQQLRRMATAGAFLAADTPPIRTAQTEALHSAWERFRKVSGNKDARLAVLIMLIEGVNFSKLIADCAMRNDTKSWWGLTASGITITSTMFDLASVSVKAVSGAESWNYQRPKLAGGLLGRAASIITAVLDFKDAKKFSNKENYYLVCAFLAKGMLGSANGALTVAVTFTYAAPMIRRLTGRAVIGAATQAVGARATAIIGARILFMSAGAWVTVIMFGIQILIWVIVDDDLQEWCEYCAFGKKRNSANGYLNVKYQQEALQKALKEMGINDDAGDVPAKEVHL
jgi:hypothetical protein